MNATLVKVITSAVCAVVAGVVVAIAPKTLAVAVAAGGAGFAGWKYIAAWEAEKAVQAVKDAAAKVGVKL